MQTEAWLAGEPQGGEGLLHGDTPALELASQEGSSGSILRALAG